MIPLLFLHANEKDGMNFKHLHSIGHSGVIVAYFQFRHFADLWLWWLLGNELAFTMPVHFFSFYQLKKKKKKRIYFFISNILILKE